MSIMGRKSGLLVVVTLGAVVAVAWHRPAGSASAEFNYPWRYSLRMRGHGPGTACGRRPIDVVFRVYDQRANRTYGLRLT
jgi:hypothetical protein